MTLFGISLHLPESLEVQAVAMKMIGLTIMCSALMYLDLFDTRVAAMVLAGAIGGGVTWLFGVRQQYGWKATIIQAVVAGAFAISADVLSFLL